MDVPYFDIFWFSSFFSSRTPDGIGSSSVAVAETSGLATVLLERGARAPQPHVPAVCNLAVHWFRLGGSSPTRGLVSCAWLQDVREGEQAGRPGSQLPLACCCWLPWCTLPSAVARRIGRAWSWQVCRQEGTRDTVAGAFFAVFRISRTYSILFIAYSAFNSVFHEI